MGICCSKKKPPLSPSPSSAAKKHNEIEEEEKVAEIDVEENRMEILKPKQVNETTEIDVSVAQTTRKKADACSENRKEERKKGEDTITNILVIPAEEAAVRTSSCTKEEVDAILIQCGRLSRSSSAKNDTNHRKYSGSKRSYDFDNDKSRRGEEEEEEPSNLSRPSPRHRTPNRDPNRSESRDRVSGGRRLSRSPGRRSDGPASFASDKPRQMQPGKMVSVPAREKGGCVNAIITHTAATSSNKRSAASSRSNSPARMDLNENGLVVHRPHSLSRSSSRKTENSPCRRNPMAEIDDNSLRQNQSTGGNIISAEKSRQGEEETVLRKPSPKRNNATTDVPKGIKTNNNTISNCVREQLMSCRSKEKQREPEIVEEDSEVKRGAKGTDAEILNVRSITRRRRSSKDFDQLERVPPNPTFYTSTLLEDIQNYHHQQQNAAFSLPACISKACSIIEAVADLNSSSSDQSNNNDNGIGGLASRGPIVESEIKVKDDLIEPSLHKYVTVREDLGGEMEPQESAGSNSFIGQPWASSWGPNSFDSTDRYWVSQSNDDEEEEELPQEVVHDFDSRGRNLRGRGSSSNVLLPNGMMISSGKKGVSDNRQQQHGVVGVSGGNAKGLGRAHSLPLAASTS